MPKVNPYLNFDNRCREAMTFYHECLGGDLFLQTVGELPEMAAMMPASFKDSILHAELTIGDTKIMASDMNRDKPLEGNTCQTCINCDSEEQINDFFKKLSAGGKVTEPVGDMPWGAKYGSLTDKFGKHWLFNFQKR
ncbi:MAG: VOC family protein [Gemmatimonadaceae bacterium]|nr:VOC family protein [Chitinophagaceae bacterium]